MHVQRPGAADNESRVTRAIGAAAARTGVAFDFLLAQARIESALDPDARAETSSASGLFQFTRQTWLGTVHDFGRRHGLGWAADAIRQDADGAHRIDDPELADAVLKLRDDPDAAAAMAAEFANANAGRLGEALGRDPEPVDLYLAHFLGPAGAVRFLTAHSAAPGSPAAPLFPDAARANRGVFFAADGSARSLAEIRDGFAKRLASSAAAPVPAPAMSLPSTPAFARRVADTPAHDHVASLIAIEPMPERLSLAYARRAYERLAKLDGWQR